MSNQFEKKIEDLFLDNSKTLQKEDLDVLIKEISAKLLTEKPSNRQSSSTIANEILKLLPKFEFNEKALGQANTRDRKEFQMFMGSRLKSAKSLKEKLNVLNGFCGTAEKFTDTRSVLSNLMMLKIMKNIVVGSSPGIGGMQFEAFIAALFGGVQVSDQSAVDVKINDELYQIKLLKQGGSARIARKNIEALKGQELKFIIVNKLSDTSLVFYELSTKPEMKNEKVEFSINYTEYKNHELGRVEIKDEVFVSYSGLLKQNVLNLLSEVASLTENINIFYFKNSTDAAREGLTNTSNIAKNIKEQI